MTREQDNNELFRTIWKIANELRGSVDGWNFKVYVLYTIFYRFVSEKISYVVKGLYGINYADVSDDRAEQFRIDLFGKLGYFILPSDLFCNIIDQLESDDCFGDTLKKSFLHFVESDSSPKDDNKLFGLFSDFDFANPRLVRNLDDKNLLLKKVFKSISQLDIEYSDDYSNKYGELFDYLMKMFASQSGKSGGEAYTPPQVSKLLGKIAVTNNPNPKSVYDSSCGSGTLLLNVYNNLSDTKSILYGQDCNFSAQNLCRINLMLHNISPNQFSIALGDSLSDPFHWDFKPFDIVVSDFPKSITWDGEDNPLIKNDPRFIPAGIIPSKTKADWAFVLHNLAWLSGKGIGVLLMSTNNLYSGGRDSLIRNYLIRNNYVDAIIQLPSNLLYGFSMPVCIVVLKRCRTTDEILFINATNEYEKDGHKNTISDISIKKIVEAYSSRRDCIGFSKSIKSEEIIGDSILYVPYYVDEVIAEENIDIKKLNDEFKAIEKHKTSLVDYSIKSNSIGALLNGEKTEIKLGDIAVVSVGKQPNKTEISDSGEYPIVSMGVKTAHYYNKSNCKSNSIVINRNGPNAGNVGIFKEQIFLNSDCFSVVPNSSVNIDYLYYYLKNKELEIKKLSLGYMNSRIDIDSLRNFKIMIPTKEQQIKIVDYLSQINEFENCLLKELEIKRKQFKYYSNQLFSKNKQ